ncbi:hypothetical protein A2454_00605 [Candidatus Peribacteria bacterium RIFOXYC2_FULL_55_14]|nr:MAG: hypothetical protein A2198_05265 [Candidatus Peribacteria bacterium RIFOXYA1_FULL_56_14]OGJ72975.1 MAG: hypothetical protein A2217_06775 [Candidatus Peribacteria bacterium RIFOXYA2_FULL_55_28]OGJ73964.1 MAG: hypothetical protein A2384_05045 [Candidatus Peribacteria bacterium RIFOXYB1_FULL_54_35]OGJ76141.1 MAG: hypothetical protein A2327_04515 [Candidatus Peribacteria bacterium RIFOXYB2_FULL_54_17]OGJ79601.1 MAG: hypothetical protein A2424_01000 [Candidatus Peribacteria bacterium RIFOXYC
MDLIPQNLIRFAALHSMLFSQGRHSLLMKLLRQLLGFLFCFNVSLVEGILIFHQMKRISDRKLPLQIQSLEILKAASKLFVASYCRVHKTILHIFCHHSIEFSEMLRILSGINIDCILRHLRKTSHSIQYP